MFNDLLFMPDGAGFAGVRIEIEYNLSDYHSLQLLCRGQGDYFGYKVVLRHRGENTQPFPSYEHMFQVIAISYSYRSVLQLNSTVVVIHIPSWFDNFRLFHVLMVELQIFNTKNINYKIKVCSN